jgi:N utilization substance protein A
VCNALQPAEISKVIIDQDANTMEVIVADDQLSLAIGKRGQNVRLAAKLTGWRIDVRSESKEEKITGESFERLMAIDGMDEDTATMLFDNGYRTPEDIARATLAELTSFMGVTEEKGLTLIHGAFRYLANPPEKEAKEPVEAGEELEDEMDLEAEEEAGEELAAGAEDIAGLSTTGTEEQRDEDAHAESESRSASKGTAEDRPTA